MRLWSLHPKHLDAKGLVALWREGLLAQKVLCGKTKGYRNHPQLLRFKGHINPKGAIAVYLTEVWKEAAHRGYHFDKTKIIKHRTNKRIMVTTGQLKYEHEWLCTKLKVRTPDGYQKTRKDKIKQHPIMKVQRGRVEPWEKVRSQNA